MLSVQNPHLGALCGIEPYIVIVGSPPRSYSASLLGQGLFAGLAEEWNPYAQDLYWPLPPTE